MGLEPGSDLDRYRIIGPLAIGGMGVIYRARDTELHRDVAIKVLPEGYATDRRARVRFKREARAAASLSHPNVTRVYDFGHWEAIPYVVMELLEGEPLSDRLAREGSLQWVEAATIARAIAAGLAAAHGAGVIHRDIKPANIFVTSAGEVKILDFGLARLDHPDSEESSDRCPTASGAVLGTIGYMSPEQATCRPVDSRSDIFSLGCTLHEMLTGVRPFERSTPVATALAIAEEEAPSLARVGVEVPPVLESLIARCLKKRPQDRWPTAAVVGESLGALLSGGGQHTEAGSQLEATARLSWLRSGVRRRRIAALVGIALLVVLAPLLYATIFGSSKRIESLAVLPFTTHSDEDDSYFTDGLTEAIIVELARIQELRVISRTSVDRFKGSPKSASEIARELGVDAVVEGSVTRSNERVRVVVRMIDAGSDEYVLGRSFESDLGAILSLQREIASTLAREIKVTATPPDQRQMAGDREINPRAHDLNLKGRQELYTGTRPGALRAIEYFNEAIFLDPEYAPGFAGLADAYIVLAHLETDQPPRERIERGRAAAQRALELDPGLAEAHVSLGAIAAECDWDWAAGRSHYRRALRINPGSAEAHERHATMMTALGRFDEAESHARRAEELDPFSPRARIVLARVYYYSGRFEEAGDRAKETITLDPSFCEAPALLSLSQQQQGRLTEAISERFAALRLCAVDPQISPELGYLQALSGNQEAARRMLQRFDRVDNRVYVPAIARATVHLGLGEHEKTMSWLEKAHEDRDAKVLFLAVDPVYEPLHHQPRFRALLRHMKLPLPQAASP